jgi:hypothetical protein
MIQRRAAELGTRVRVGCHTFRATGITAYLEAGGTLENAQAMAAHESPRTTKLYDSTGDEITLDEVEGRRAGHQRLVTAAAETNVCRRVRLQASVLPRIFVVRIVLLPPLHVILLILQILLAHRMIVPRMSADAPGERPEDAVTSHMTGQRPSRPTTQTANCVGRRAGHQEAGDRSGDEKCVSHAFPPHCWAMCFWKTISSFVFWVTSFSVSPPFSSV